MKRLPAVFFCLSIASFPLPGRSEAGSLVQDPTPPGTYQDLADIERDLDKAKQDGEADVHLFTLADKNKKEFETQVPNGEQSRKIRGCGFRKF